MAILDGELVGRAQELSELDALLGLAASGSPQCVIIEGPEGIGKSALVAAFAARHPGVAALRATGSEWERALQGGMLGQLGIVPARGPADTDEPAGTHPGGEEGTHDAGWSPPAEQPAWLPAGMAALDRLTALAEGGPDTSTPAEGRTPAPDGAPAPDRSPAGAHSAALVVLDALEHADALSLEALAYAFRRLAVPLLMLGTMGPAGAHPGSPAAVFAAAVGARRLRLAPLGPAALRGLASARAGLELSAEALEALMGASRGYPGLALEALAEGEELLGASAMASEGPRSVPASVASRTARALEGLSRSARALVEAVGILGGTPAAADAAALAGLDCTPEAVLAAADEAWSAGLLDCWNVAGTLRVAVREELVRRAVVDGLGPGARAALHSRAAAQAPSTRERVHHLVAAATSPDAAIAGEADALAAAESTAGNWSAAADALLAASRLHTEPRLREERLLEAAEAMIGAGDLPRAAPLIRQIESLPQSALRDAALAYYAIHRGHARRAGALLERAWASRPADTSREVSSRIAQYRVLHSFASWDSPSLLAWTETAVRLSGPDSTAGLEARAMLGLGLGSAGRHREAHAAYRELATSPHLGARSQRLQLGRGWLALALDDLDEARLELRAAIQPARRPGSLRITLWAHAMLARAEFLGGRWDDALATARAGLALNTPVGMELVDPLLHWTAAQVLALRADADAAEQHAAAAASAAEAYPVMHLGAAMAAAAVAEARGDHPAVLRACEPVVRLDRTRGIDEPGFWPWQDVYAKALVRTGDLDAADAFLRPLEARARELSHRSTTARLASVRGRILAARGETDHAMASFEGALGAIAGLALPYDSARIRFAYGQTLRRAGRRRDAAAVLSTARDGFAALGAVVDAARCERELQAAGTGTGAVASMGAAAGGQAAGPVPGVPAGAAFTAQEEAVIRLVASGMSNRDAARELFVSVKTVQYHLTRIYAKLGISSRSELAAGFAAGRPASAARPAAGPD
ncbi:LuxR family transcriptional regulator [Sinomonas halotolerans]|uniref:LuxR family transcriptional regulator n=1 Tax=Sinomonas halotolerans TaxID=1644133 RepID=A0ABU9WWX2_9MICC